MQPVCHQGEVGLFLIVALALQWLPALGVDHIHAPLSRTWVRDSCLQVCPLFDISDPRIPSAVLSVALFQAAPGRLGLRSPFPSLVSWCRPPPPQPCQDGRLGIIPQGISVSHVGPAPSSPHTHSYQNNPPEVDLLSFSGHTGPLAPHCLMSTPILCGRGEGNGGRIWDTSVGHSSCLRHGAVRWPQTQLVAIPFNSASSMSLPPYCPGLDSGLHLTWMTAEAFPIGLHIAKLVSLPFSPLHCG